MVLIRLGVSPPAFFCFLLEISNFNILIHSISIKRLNVEGQKKKEKARTPPPPPQKKIKRGLGG